MIREAAAVDAETLVELEAAASTAGLAHIFGPDLPFPTDDVRARWLLVLGEPGLTVLLDYDGDMPVGYVAYGNGWLQHLGVIPGQWGIGRGRVLHDRALAGIAEQGASEASLWVLVDNLRARAFYARLGWVDSGERDNEVFPPYPAKMRMTRAAATLR